MKRYIAMAISGGALVGAGVGLWSPPAGLVVSGVELVGGAYAGAYMAAKGGLKRP